MKKQHLLLVFLSLYMLFSCVGCGTDSSGEVPTEPITFSYDPDAYDESRTETGSLIDQYGFDILPTIYVEAGTGSLTAEMFFASYDGQELTIGQELTAEELAVFGASYSVPVVYKGYDLEIEVEIVDTTAPEIQKLDDILVKAGDTIAYKKAVSYSDNSSNELALAIDNSAVDTQTPGEYTVVYTVTDAGGNSAQIQVTLTVVEAASHTEEDVKDLAMAVLDEVYDPDASQYDNALALFKWVHRSISYTHSSGDRSSVWAGAYEGLHDGRGDCYAFYATYAVLLTYAGIDNECVARVSDSSNHWWNLVNTGDGWYHCDTSPRRNGDGYFCFMQTDAQVEAYTRAYPEKPDYYTFDSSLLPERETTIIYGYDPDTIYQKYNTEAINRRLAELEAEEPDDLTDEAEQFIDEEEEVQEDQEEQEDDLSGDNAEASDDAAAEEESTATGKKKKKKKDKTTDSKTDADSAADAASDAGAETDSSAEADSSTDTEDGAQAAGQTTEAEGDAEGDAGAQEAEENASGENAASE